MTRQVVVGLGANLGSRLTTMRCAVDLLDAAEGVRVLETSRVYDTEPVGPPQPRYLNAAVLVETDRPLRALLETLLEVERSLGRERRERWGARLLDLDILFAGDERVQEEGLTVPHPRLGERPFALAPLLDVAPDAPGMRHALDRAGGPPPVWDVLRIDPSDPPWRITRSGPERRVEAAERDADDALASALTALGRELSGGPVRPTQHRVGGCAQQDDPAGALAVLTEAVGEGFRVSWVTLSQPGERRAVRLVGCAGDPPTARPRPSEVSVAESKEWQTAHAAVTIAVAGGESAK